MKSILGHPTLIPRCWKSLIYLLTTILFLLLSCTWRAGVQIHLFSEKWPQSDALIKDKVREKKYYHPFFFLWVGTEAHGNLLIHSKTLCQSWNFNLDLLSLCSAISNVSVKADLNFCHISEGSRPQTGLLQLPYMTAMPQRVALSDRRYFLSLLAR